MSDSIKKWHEMQQDKELKVFESPDGGDTVTARPFGGDIEDRVVIQHPQKEEYEIKQKAYRLLCEEDERVIRMAMKILNIGE